MGVTTMARLQIILVSLFSLACASHVSAQALPERTSVGAFVGVLEGDATYDTGPGFELRYGYAPSTFFGLELSLGIIDTSMLARTSDTLTQPRDARLITSSLTSLLYISEGRLHPYLLAGIGTLTDEETYLAGSVGLGAGYAIDDTWSVRLEGRAWLSESAPATDRFQHLQMSVGATYAWGGEADLDGDGIPNLLDQCRSDAEDKDGFEDSDGCPDFDNDEDGVDDDEDKCPLKKEDKDDDRDEDGCPDEDTDKDGVEDVDDACPADPEDKDGFEDADGCPDEDNDSDGVADADDKCPLEAEDQDSFQDEDGCPEPDNDNDGVLDADDRCPKEAGPDGGCPVKAEDAE